MIEETIDEEDEHEQEEKKMQTINVIRQKKREA